MDSKKIRTAVGRFFGRLGLNFCSLIVRIIPGRYIYGFARNLATLAYWIAARQRKIALDSLAMAFGAQKSKKDLEAIAQECFISMAKSGVELLFLLDKPALLKERVELSGRENLQKALSGGKGVILVSAHFGNFPLLLARLSLEGYKAAAIMRHMRDERIEKMFMAKRRRLNIKTIYSQPRQACVESTIKALRSNELVFIPLDQNFGTGGVFVNFFGHKAATATGPVVLAERTGAAVIPCFIIRQKDDTHKVIFEPPLELKEGSDRREALIINIQRLTGIIESYIRKYPAEWGWIHRRWKSRPAQN